MDILVCYDISDDARRLKAAKILDDYGDRVQYSVFEIPDLSPELLEVCRRRIEAVIEPSEGDSVRFYSLCRSCRKAIFVLGKGAKPMDNPDIIVV